MLGWEFPPFISGGLGTACYGLTKALDAMGLEVTFVLPQSVDNRYAGHVKLLSPQDIKVSRQVSIPGESFQYDYELNELKHVRFHKIKTLLKPYSTPEEYQQLLEKAIRENRMLASSDSTDWFMKYYDEMSGGSSLQCHYGGDIYTEVYRYAASAAQLAMAEDFDVVHAHDWMTYPAGIAAAAVTARPLIVHVHSTEFDRSGENVNQVIYDIERKGMHAADRIIAVSNLTRNTIISRYCVSGNKVEVVHNGVDSNGADESTQAKSVIKKGEKIVLFLGRITMQKGPEYFLAAAKKVASVMDNVKFVMAGSGDMMHRAVEMAAEFGIGHKVLFTGFLRGDDVKSIYQMADLYVMPSVSEPFGIAPLEALDHDVPVIISKQSGVSEVLTHALKVDFWDVNEMANKMVAVLKYPPLHTTLREHGNFEVRKICWADSARRCAEIYESSLSAVV